jgi:hypothetical protein
MTSIEWLIDQMFKQGYFDGNKPLTFTNLDHLQQQAVEMHKEEIKNAWDNRNKDVIKSDGKTAEQYYNENYGSKGSDITSSQTEISDEEIEKAANYFYPLIGEQSKKALWKSGCKWYREQLKQINNDIHRNNNRSN